MENNVYRKLSIKDVKRMLCIIKIDKIYNKSELYDFLSEELAKFLNSKILFKKTILFPEDFNGNKDLTFISVLSTSHIVISTYTEEDCTYIDLDVAWCSGKDMSKEDLEKILLKYFKKYNIERIIFL